MILTALVVAGLWLALMVATGWWLARTSSPVRCGACDADMGAAPIRDTSDGLKIACPRCGAGHLWHG